MNSLRSQWTLPADECYLNHGSFGPSPLAVQEVRRYWSERLEQNPMKLFLREMEDFLDESCEMLGSRFGTAARNLALVDNATVGMNSVARTVELQPGDEVLLNDHEYGAVFRIWRERCEETGAKIVSAKLPPPFHDADQLVEQLFAFATDKTRVMVVSHVTSPTALIFPVETICREAQQRGIAVCVDGPHAPAHIPLDIDQLGCDFYTASCHKWMCASFGTGFLYVHPRWQEAIKPPVISWGGSLSGKPRRWQDEFHWLGTRDPAPWASIPAALRFLEEIGLENFRQSTHQLTTQAKNRIEELTGRQSPFTYPDDWFGSMAAVPLPAFRWQPKHPAIPDPLQTALWQQHAIEIPVVHWNEHRLIRVSCHLYNDEQDIEKLMTALKQELPRFTD